MDAREAILQELVKGRVTGAGKVDGRRAVALGERVIPGQELAQMPHSDLYMMRGKAEGQDAQDLLAKYEHRAFAREVVKDNPLMALPLLVATPGYQVAKALHLTNSRSKPSMEQLAQGMTGIIDGLLQR